MPIGIKAFTSDPVLGQGFNVQVCPQQNPMPGSQKGVQMTGDKENISKKGEAIILLPKERSWSPLFENLNHFAKDFKIERNQPAEQQERKPMFK